MAILDGRLGSLARKRPSSMSSLREAQSNFSSSSIRDLMHVAKL